MLAILYGFHSENNFWKNSHKNFNFEPYKKCVTEKRTYVNKGANVLNPYLLTVLLSIPFSKLPWCTVFFWAILNLMVKYILRRQHNLKNLAGHYFRRKNEFQLSSLWSCDQVSAICLPSRYWVRLWSSKFGSYFNIQCGVWTINDVLSGYILCGPSMMEQGGNQW